MIRIVSDYDPVVTRQPAPMPHGEGPVMSDDRYDEVLRTIAGHRALAGENVRLPDGSGAGLRRSLGVAGVVCHLRCLSG